jgi:hypothetical protein
VVTSRDLEILFYAFGALICSGSALLLAIQMLIIFPQQEKKKEKPKPKRGSARPAGEETDWWDQKPDDSGWTNGDYIVAAEIFDDWQD